MHRTSFALYCILVIAHGSLGCKGGSSSPPQDNRPKVEITSPTVPQSGIVDLDFTLTQRSGISVNILPEFSLDGGNTYQRATEAPGTSVVGLTSDPQGQSHLYQWDSRSDGLALTVPESNVTFRITPYIDAAGVEGETDPFEVDNSAGVVIVTGVSPEWGPLGTVITISGQGFSTTQSENTVTFGDIGGTGISVPVTGATANLLTLPVPPPAPQPLRDLSGPLTVTVLGQKSNAVQFVATTLGAPRISVIRTTSIEGNSLPWFHEGTGSAKIQILLRKDEVGSAGVIDGFRWATSTGLSPGNTSAVTVPTVGMRMGHTTLENPTHIQEINYNVDPPREVALVANYSIPANQVGFVDIPFSGVFPYNGRDNLLIELEGVGGSGRYFWNVGRRPEERRAWELGSGYAWRDIILPSLELSFSETDTDDSYSAIFPAIFDLNVLGPCIPPNCTPPSFDKVFFTQPTKVQVILLSREISGSGTLKGIAWKPPEYSASVGETYSNLAISVGHHPFNQMTTNFVTPLTTVRAPGDYTIPAGESGFIPIPLDPPFNFIYDGLQNLVVEIFCDGGSSLVNPADSMNITPVRRLLWASSPAAVTGTLEFEFISLRLEFE